MARGNSIQQDGRIKHLVHHTPPLASAKVDFAIHLMSKIGSFGSEHH